MTSREAFRVLKPEGRMVVSDIVLERPLPPKLKSDQDLYAACISGALLRRDYIKAIRDAGFRDLELLSDRTYQASPEQEDPITADASDTLIGIAASITVLAHKRK